MEDFNDIEEKKSKFKPLAIIIILLGLILVGWYGFKPTLNVESSCESVCLENGALTSSNNGEFCTCIFEENQKTLTIDEWKCKNQSIKEKTELCKNCQASIVVEIINLIRQNGYIEIPLENEVIRLGELR